MAASRAPEAASSSSSSSTSTSTSTRSLYTYDVFLSFRGEDTRTNFTDHLYTALVDRGIHTFRDDDEIERGKSLKPELDKAIQESRVSIIVFSKNYAFSRWCLDELVMILEQKKVSSKHVVLPVFYDVSPSEIRKQTGRTGEAFEKHKENLELMEKVNGWRKALKEVADLVGMELADRHEVEFIKKIINIIELKLRRTPLFVAPILIGMDSRAKNINKWLRDDSSEVSLLGICGMGGIGKTTIAKFVYDENYESFDGSCFLANVREMSDKPGGLADLQRQLLSSILNKKHKKICNTHEGLMEIKKAISGKRVLFVLDDVDENEQLDALRGMLDWFYRGSKIIITTRYERLLKPYEVFKVGELGHNESVKLFSFYAFGKDRPIEGFAEHTKNVVKICRGLPLALQVLGASLSGRTILQWTSEVKKLQAIPPGEILNKLKISYNCLQDEHDKRLFLDIACFFVGNDKDYTVKVLDSTNTYADVGIQNLIDRYLLAIDSRNKLMMHQLIRDMGRNIVNQESLELERRSRLWHEEEAHGVLKNKTGTIIIEGLALDMWVLIKDDNIARKRRYDESLNKASPLTCICSFFDCFGCFSFLLGQQQSADLRNQDSDLRTDALEKMEKLRLLKLNYTQLVGRYHNFPKNLKWLCWHGFPLKYMPMELSLEKLVALDLCHSKLEEVWAGNKFLGSLKILNLSYSERLTKTPNFLGVPNLERLILKGCVNLSEICESIEFLEELDLLDIKDCKNLRKLPRNMHKLVSLHTLIISGCSNLFAINKASAANWQGKWWRSSVSLLSHEVPRPIKTPEILWASLPNSLTSLNLSRCNLSDDSLPYAFSKLSLLKKLDLSFNSFLSLPDSISRLGNLEWLNLERCEYIHSVLGLPSNLKKLDLGSCGQLKEITFQSAPYQLCEIETLFCHKVIEVQGIFKREPIRNVEKGIIKNLGIDIGSMRNLEVSLKGLSNIRRDPIQGLYEFGIFSTFVPKGEVPSFFSHKSRGSSISFIVPLLPNLRIRNLNVCFVYANYNYGVFPWPSVAKIYNKTKDLTWIYIPTYFRIPHREDFAWLSQWNFGNKLEGGNEVTVSMVGNNDLQVKECGINIVYDSEQQEENNGNNQCDNTYFFHNAVVGGDLSGFKLSTGAYFLSRRLFLEGYYTRIDERSWFWNIFGDTIDYRVEEFKQSQLSRNQACSICC